MTLFLYFKFSTTLIIKFLLFAFLISSVANHIYSNVLILIFHIYLHILSRSGVFVAEFVER